MSPPATLPETLSGLFRLWNGRRGTRAMPSRSDFDIAELMPWLADLHLVAVRPDGMRFTVFAVGPAGRYGAEMTGRCVADLEPSELAREVEDAYRDAAEARAPVFSAQTIPDIGGRSRRWARLILPLSDDGATVDRLFVAMWDERTATEPRNPTVQSILVSRWLSAEAAGQMPQPFHAPFLPAERAPAAFVG